MTNERANHMKTKLAFMIFAVATVFCTQATPTENTYAAVTNDWYNGNWTNVYELAQVRLAANTNDIVGAYIMKEYDIRFSDNAALSNSIQRLIRSGDAVTLPAFAEQWSSRRQGYEFYLDQVIPMITDELRAQEQSKAFRTHIPMNCTHILKLLWDENLW